MSKIVDGFRENESIVETVKGAKFWGRLIAFHALGTGNPGAVVEAIDPGFAGTRHVYPLSQLRIPGATDAR